MIEVQGLTRRYGAHTALLDVSTTIAAGQVVGLLGHNGAGKTTMMKVLTGFLEPSAGRVTVGGLDVVHERTAVQRRIGYLPENAPLYSDQTVVDYLYGLAALRGVPTAQQASAVAEAAEAVGLHGRMTQRIGTLSKGLKQRVGIAQAIVHRPDVLILDEPTNGLDPSQIESIRELVRALAQHSTVLLSTHILQEVEAVCDRVLVLAAGRLVADGSLRDLTRASALDVAIQGADDAAHVLTGLTGVQSVTALGPDPDLEGFTRYVVKCDPGQDLPASDVAEAIVRAGWSLGRLSPAQRRLEQAFADLSRQVSP
jgi:ABC-2 type transport system ATP-binding protein